MCKCVLWKDSAKAISDVLLLSWEDEAAASRVFFCQVSNEEAELRVCHVSTDCTLSRILGRLSVLAVRRLLKWTYRPLTTQAQFTFRMAQLAVWSCKLLNVCSLLAKRCWLHRLFVSDWVSHKLNLSCFCQDVAPWESEKTVADMEKYVWDLNPSKESLIRTLQAMKTAKVRCGSLFLRRGGGGHCGGASVLLFHIASCNGPDAILWSISTGVGLDTFLVCYAHGYCPTTIAVILFTGVWEWESTTSLHQHAACQYSRSWNYRLSIRSPGIQGLGRRSGQWRGKHLQLGQI